MRVLVLYNVADDDRLGGVEHLLTFVSVGTEDGGIGVDVLASGVPVAADALGDGRDNAAASRDGIDELLSSVVVVISHSAS